ncbi:autophagy-related protein 27 [Sporobolomyces salmoneus]|uniref:autophagy-related protein 27 n=1 Tax=Sporobolomyces salmoneus TaxID=183962 RepID=UPI00316C71C6
MRSTTLLLASLPLALAGFDCKDRLSLNGNSFDFSRLAGVHRFEERTNTPPTVTKTKYDLSICSSLPPPSSDIPSSDVCPPGTRVCMTSFTSRDGLEDRLLSVVPIAGELEGGKEMTVNAIKIEGVEEAKEWMLEINGGRYNEVDQTARIEMKCDENAKETVPKVKEYHSKQGVLDLEWTTWAACPVSDDSTPPPGGGNDGDNDGDDDEKSSKGGLGFFGWFFTLIFLGLIAYFVLGAYHNYTTYGATGWDMIPHRDMWRDLPWVLSDLIRPRGGSRAGYSSLG